MASYYSSSNFPPENTPPSATTQSPVAAPSAPQVFSAPDSTPFPTEGGGLPSSIDITVTTPSPALPPEETTTYSPGLTGPTSPVINTAIVRPGNAPVVIETEGILTNQYTSGGEFVLTATGENYIGAYHIHPDKGPMVGPLHVSTPHEYLTPLSLVNVPPTPSPNDSIIDSVDNTDLGALIRPAATFNTDANDPATVNTPDLIPVFVPTITAPTFTPEGTTYVGDEPLSNGNNIMYRGIISDNKGNLFLIPYAAPSIVKYNIDNNTTDFINLPADSTGLQKYVGGVLASNGKIYTGSHAGNKGPLVIDTTGPEPIISEIDFQTTGLQARGPSIVDDIVYIPSYTGGKAWRLVDTTNDQPLPSIQWPEPPRTDEVYNVRPNWESEGGMFYDTLFGSVAANNGKVYGMPFGASRINILDTATNTVTWGKDSLTGNAPISTGSPTTFVLLNATSFNKYALGALAPNGNIYAHGRRARSILKIDTTTDTATEIPYPDEIIQLMVDDLSVSSGITKKSAAFSSVLGSDGKIYSVPWGIPYLLWIDPTDDSIGYSNISELLGVKTGALGRNSAWFTFGTSIGDSLYLSPGTADRILKIDLTTLVNENPDPQPPIPSATFNTNGDDPSVTINDVDGAVVDLPGPANPAIVNDAGVIFNVDNNGNIINVAGNGNTNNFAGYGNNFNVGAGSPNPNSGGTGGTVDEPEDSDYFTGTGNPGGKRLKCRDDNYITDNDTDGANLHWVEGQVQAKGGTVDVAGRNREGKGVARGLPEGADVKSLVDVEINPGGVLSVDPPKIKDGGGQRHDYEATISVPDNYTNRGKQLVCLISAYTAMTGVVFKCYGKSKNDPGPQKKDINGNLIDFANPYWNQQAENLVGQNAVNNFVGGDSRIFELPVFTAVTNLLDVELGKIVRVNVDNTGGDVVPNLPGPLKAVLDIEPPDKDYENKAEISPYLKCEVTIYTALSVTTPPPPPTTTTRPPPPGLPLDECVLECLEFTTAGPPIPGRERPVPRRLTIAFDRTTLPPVFALGSSGISIVPVVPVVQVPTTTTTTTTTTTINPCPPECDIPSF